MSKTYVAGGDINPCRFLKADTTADNTVLQATANDPLVGISQENARAAPIPGASTLAAASGQELWVHTPGGVSQDRCLLQYGDTVTAGDLLKADANGMGVPIASGSAPLQNVGARAIQAGSANDYGLVELLIQQASPGGAEYEEFVYTLANLAANADLAETIIWAPTQDVTITGIYLTPDGDDAGIDGSNTSVWLFQNGGDTIVTETFDDGTAFPDDGVQTALTPLTNASVSAGGNVNLTVTNGTTADLPATLVTIRYTFD